MNILIISGHPDLNTSIVNRTILETLENKLPNVEIRKLDELYPDYKLDVKLEQTALLKADVIVFQFPVHWYSVPAILKLYIDKIFLHDWAYGSKGKALVGKRIIFSATFGAPSALYTKNGVFKHEPQEFSYFLQNFATLCNMTPEPFVFDCGMNYIEGVTAPEVKDEIISKARAQAEKIISTINK